MLTFQALREANNGRCEGPAFNHAINDWSPNDWATALMGEGGELCNMLKKRRRGEAIPDKDIAHELADIQIYLDLLAQRLGINLEAAVIEKFNIVSAKRGSDIRL